MIKRSELEELMNNAPVLATLGDSKAAEELLAVLEHPGFIHLWGLLMGARQGIYAMLSQVPLGNAQQVTHAAVLQGKIRGIEMFYETALEHAVPDGVSVKEGA